MNSVTLHSPPAYGVVVREQLRAVRLALRKEGVFFLGFLSLIGVLTISAAMAARHIVIHKNGNINYSFDMSGADDLMLMWTSVQYTGVICLAGMLVPFGVWRSEGPSHRVYHWAMPIARGPHTLTKALAGWLWLVAAVTIYMAFMIGLQHVVIDILGYHLLTVSDIVSNGVAGKLMVSLTATTIIYLLTSTAVIGSNHPWRWIGGLLVTYMVAFNCCGILDLHQVAHTLESVMTGDYGLFRALFGGLVYGSWVKAALFWTMVSGVGVCLAAYYRGEG